MPRALELPEKTATTVLLSQNNKNKLKEAADLNGVPVSRYMRNVLLSSLPQ
ncbi:MAG: hypothetical protein ACKN9E_06960 [Microcystaceae cyanobacterium]